MAPGARAPLCPPLGTPLGKDMISAAGSEMKLAPLFLIFFLAWNTFSQNFQTSGPKTNRSDFQKNFKKSSAYLGTFSCFFFQGYRPYDTAPHIAFLHFVSILIHKLRWPTLCISCRFQQRQWRYAPWQIAHTVEVIQLGNDALCNEPLWQHCSVLTMKLQTGFAD